MATATSYTQAQIDDMDGARGDQIQAVSDEGIQTAGLDSNGHLILTRNDTSVIDAGVVSSPTGSVVMYTALSAPPGWLLCDGSAVSRTTYPDLWALLGTRFGAGDGTTTFNVPNMQARFPRMDTAALAANGGSAAAHTHSVANHDHDLDGGSPQAYARIRMLTGPGPNIHEERINTASWNAGFAGDLPNPITENLASTAGTKVAGHTDVTALTSNGTAVLPPYINLMFIIKT